jgi:hypothetical protein
VTWWRQLSVTWRNLLILGVLAVGATRVGMWVQVQLETPEALRAMDRSLRAAVDSSLVALAKEKQWNLLQLARLDARADSVFLEIQRLATGVEGIRLELCVERAERDGLSARICTRSAARGSP